MFSEEYRMASSPHQFIKALLLLTVPLLLSFGCASTRQFVPLPTEATLADHGVLVQAKRRSPDIGVSCGLEVWDNGKEIGVLGVGGQIEWTRLPGAMRIDVRDCNDFSYRPLEILTEAAHRYELTLEMPFFPSGKQAAILSKVERLPGDLRIQPQALQIAADATARRPIPKKIPIQMRFEKAVLSESIRKIRGKGYPENITDTFSSDDSEIIASVKLMNLSGKHNIKWDWIAPDNSLYYSTGNKSINAPDNKYLKEVTALHRLGVRGKRGAAYPGAWKVNIYLDDKNIATAFFKLEAAASIDDLSDDRPKPKRAKTRLFDDW